MATYKHLRSSTANKRPTTSIADGQLAINSNAASAGLFFKDSTGATIIKVGPVHVGTTAPNATPGAGGSSGNSTGEVWLDTSLTPVGVKIWNGSAWVNGTPAGTTTVQGLLELATDAETQAGSDTARAVTPASLQSKVSDSTSTTSSTTIASSTAVKSAYDLANAALPKSGGTVTGNLEIGTAGSLTFEGSVADGFETTIAVTNPTADRTITLPDQTGNMLVSGNASIVNADVNASAAIAGTKISPDFGSQTITTTGIVSAALGAAATPSITFTGDTNTGIFSPGADQLAISTNGARRLIITSDGKVGINTASPLSTLAVSDGSNKNIELQPGSTSYLLAYDRTAGDYLNLDIAGENLIFSTNNGSERMRLTSAGLLGLGTSSPGAKLQVATGTNDYTNTANTLGVVGPSGTGLYIGTHYDGSGAGADIVSRGFSTTMGDFRFIAANGSYASPATRMVIDGSGRVGIGTSSPSTPLEVNGAIYSKVSTTADATLAAVNSFASVFLLQQSDKAHIYTGAGQPIVFTNSNVERARITSDGKFLVGTSSSTALGVVGNHQFSVEGASAATSSISTLRTDASTSPTVITLAKSRSNAIVLDGDNVGRIEAAAHDGTDIRTPLGRIDFVVDGTPGVDDMPGRLVFSTTADGASSPTERMRIDSAGFVSLGGDTNTGFSNPSADNLAITTGGSERARIDSSGRLLVGTSTSVQVPLSSSTLGSTFYQQAGAFQPDASAVWFAYSTTATVAPNVVLAKSRGATVGTQGLVSDGDSLGRLVFEGSDGQAVGANAGFIRAAVIEGQVDGTASAGDMPGRIVLSTTADGTSSPTEEWRITNDGVICYNQLEPISKAAAATLTVAELKTGIIRYTGAAATLTLPTGTLAEGGFSGIYTNMTFEWSVINTGSGTCTIGVGTAHTIVGGATIAAGASGRFASRRTAANTFVTYRLS